MVMSDFKASYNVVSNYQSNLVISIFIKWDHYTYFTSLL